MKLGDVSDGFKSGFVAIVGRPNTGKSTLVNQLMHRKVAIVSDKPQTTRHAIRAVLNIPGAQMILMDTPGYHKPHHLLGEQLNSVVENALREVDAIVFIVDVESGVGTGDQFLAEMMNEIDTPIVLCPNKIDATSPAQRMEQIAEAGRLGDFQAIVPISGKSGENLDKLMEELSGLMPEGPRYYPEGMETDQPEHVVVAELIREKILDLTRDEVPHSVAVEIESMAPRKKSDLVDIEAYVFVERDSQKGIVIGKHGAVLKQVGTLARTELEALLGTRIYLSLRVKVRKNWRKDAAFLQRLGLDD